MLLKIFGIKKRHRTLVFSCKKQPLGVVRKKKIFFLPADANILIDFLVLEDLKNRSIPQPISVCSIKINFPAVINETTTIATSYFL